MHSEHEKKQRIEWIVNTNLMLINTWIIQKYTYFCHRTVRFIAGIFLWLPRCSIQGIGLTLLVQLLPRIVNLSVNRQMCLLQDPSVSTGYVSKCHVQYSFWSPCPSEFAVVLTRLPRTPYWKVKCGASYLTTKRSPGRIQYPPGTSLTFYCQC